MAIRTQESLSGFIASDPQLTYTERSDARFYARFGQENFQREEDGSFTKGDQFVAEGYAHEYTYERDRQSIAGEEFVAKKIGHDTARTRYDVDRTPRQAMNRDATGQAFEPPRQSAPATTSLSM